MGSLERRLERLEGRVRLLRTPAPPRPLTEDGRKERWLAGAKVCRHQDTHSGDEAYVRDVIALLAPRGELDGDLQHVRRCLAAWRPPLSETAIERVSARMAYDGDLPVECPQEWQEAFAAGEDLLARYLAVPVETLAEVLVALNEAAGEGGDVPEDAAARELEPLGITQELAERAVGPDLSKIPDEESDRRLREVLAPFYHGEQGHLVQAAIYRLLEEK